MEEDLFESIARLRRERRPAALATVIGAKGSTPAKISARMLAGPLGRIAGTVGGGCVEAEVLRSVRDVLDTGRPKTLSFRLSGDEAERTGIACGGQLEVLVESLLEPHVVLIGAGHVGQATAKLARTIGFQVTVVDDRPDFANAERFPDAHEIVVAPLDGLDAALRIGHQTHILIMTRGHAEDLTVLRWALKQDARHIGVLGSRAKRIQFEATLRAEGIRDEAIHGISMPVGLDLAAETVEEIAVSIAAELVQIRRRGKARV